MASLEGVGPWSPYRLVKAFFAHHRALSVPLLKGHRDGLGTASRSVRLTEGQRLGRESGRGSGALRRWWAHAEERSRFVVNDQTRLKAASAQVTAAPGVRWPKASTTRSAVARR